MATKHFDSILSPSHRLRLYLCLLQSMFLFVYSYHLVLPISREQAGLGLMLATITLLLLTLARHHIETAWFISLLTLGNTIVLFATFGISTHLWMLGP